jgi:hypothetical protein
MQRTKRGKAGVVFVLAGVALFAGSFVIEVSGMWGAGIALMVLGAGLWWSANRKEHDNEQS